MGEIEATSGRATPSGLPTTRPRALSLRTLAPPALLVGATLLWAWSLPEIDPDRMSDFGLVSVLPVSFMAALFLLSLSFALTIATCFGRKKYCRALVISQIVALVLLLYGTPALVEVVPRSGTVWQHLGVADYIARHGTVDRTIDAYFNWPGFFIGLAFVQRVTGLSRLAGIGAWAPVFFNLIDTVVLFNLFKFGLRDERLAWLAAWVFLCTNWIGQDILSPQAFGYFIYLNILLLMIVAAPAARRRFAWPPIDARLRSAWTQRAPRRTVNGAPSARTAPSEFGPPQSEAWVRSRPQRVLLTLAVTVLFGAVAISHQLTPYAAVIVVAALVVANVSTVRAMPVLMALIIFGWFTYSAVPFLQQFLHQDTSSLGEVRRNFSASVTDHVGGTREHELIVYVRVVMTALLWVLAILSAVVRLRRGRRDTAFLIVGIAPFVLAALQSYGGEIALRIYLFALPAAAFFVAASLASALDSWPPKWTVLAVMAFSLVFLPLFLVCRYGNERLDYFTSDDYQAVRALYRISPAGSRFFVLDSNLPWRWQRYGTDTTFPLYTYVSIYSSRLRLTPETIANTMAEKGRPAFLVFTRSQTPFATYVGGVAPETVARFESLIAKSPRFEVIYSNASSVIYRLAGRTPT